MLSPMQPLALIQGHHPLSWQITASQAAGQEQWLSARGQESRGPRLQASGSSEEAPTSAWPHPPPMDWGWGLPFDMGHQLHRGQLSSLWFFKERQSPHLLPWHPRTRRPPQEGLQPEDSWSSGAAGWVGLEQTEGWAPGPLVPDTPSVSVRLFKRKNRKTEKRVGAGQLGVLWQDRVQDFPLVVNNAPG